MRRVDRTALPQPTQRALDRRQQDVDEKCAAGSLNVENEWKGARKTKPLKTTLDALRQMAGERQRCMYCGDSHGTDIEHFWPKMAFPERLFRWPNMLLCCTECGRFKGDRFPLAADGTALLVDPTAENPWDFLDFDPNTQAFVARFDTTVNALSRKGAETVASLQLDRREALEAGYRKTHRRIVALTEGALQQAAPDAEGLSNALRDADDHGLLGWYFSGTGQSIAPFATLRERHPQVWATCIARLA